MKRSYWYIPVFFGLSLIVIFKLWKNKVHDPQVVESTLLLKMQQPIQLIKEQFPTLQKVNYKGIEMVGDENMHFLATQLLAPKTITILQKEKYAAYQVDTTLLLYPEKAIDSLTLNRHTILWDTNYYQYYYAIGVQKK